MWGTERHLQEPTRRLARTVGSSTGLERWCLHMRRQLQQCCCCIHIHALLSPPPHGWSLLREFGALDALAMPNSCWGYSLSCIPTEHQKAGASSIRSCSRSRSVDTYLAAGLDASLCMVGSWPEMDRGLTWRGESCLLTVGRTERSGRLSHLRMRQREKQHGCRCGLL